MSGAAATYCLGFINTVDNRARNNKCGGLRIKDQGNVGLVVDGTTQEIVTQSSNGAVQMGVVAALVLVFL